MTMLHYPFPIDDEVESFIQEASDDYVGLWEIAKTATENLTDHEAARDAALEIVRRLLARGLVPCTLKKDGGFTPWSEQSPDAVVDRIRGEWRALGRPPSIGEIGYFALPEPNAAGLAAPAVGRH